MKESKIRDLLAQQIDILEPGLTLLDKEAYIPNNIGTNGFIDLLARDADGQFVIIELKRTDAAARQAIHEVLKYVEGVKAHLGVKDREIRVWIVSTEWRELLVPFSRFVADSKLALTGFQIDVLDSGEIRLTPVQPIKVEKGRFIAPWHELNLYVDGASLERGIREYEESLKQKGISDYVLVILDAPDGFNERSKASLREVLSQMRSQYAQEQSSEQDIDSLLDQVDDFHYMLYFGMQMLDHQRCLQIISADPVKYEEVKEFISEMDDDEALGWLHENVYDLSPSPHSDEFEIGYPAKFKSKLLEDEGWKIRKIMRYGSFSRNELLSDEDIIGELSGSEGTTGQSLNLHIRTSNPAHLASAKTSIQQCLKDNPVWRTHLLRELDEIVLEFPDHEVDLNVFNPCAGVMTLFLSMTRGPLYVPNYSLKVMNGDNRRMYYGSLVSIEKSMAFQQIVKKYYDGKLFALLLTLTWGGYESRDTEILEDLGLVYRSFRCDVKGDERMFYQWRDDRWRSSEPVNPLAGVLEHLSTNPELVSDLELEIGTRWNGTMFFADNNVSDHRLSEIADREEGLKRQSYWIGEVSRCDLCTHDFENDTYFVDGATTLGPSALMCSDCFRKFGSGIAWGSGQLYFRNPEGWLLVGGFRPDDDFTNGTNEIDI